MRKFWIFTRKISKYPLPPGKCFQISPPTWEMFPNIPSHLANVSKYPLPPGKCYMPPVTEGRNAPGIVNYWFASREIFKYPTPQPCKMLYAAPDTPSVSMKKRP